MNKLIVNLVPTGTIPTRKMTPHVPLTPDEIVADVLKCAELGISMAHLHARDTDGSPSHDREVYAKIIGGIRAVRPDLIIVVSTSGRVAGDEESRFDPLKLPGDLTPDMASLTLGSMNFPTGPSLNSPETIIRLLDRMNERGIKPELEVFDLGMINFAHYLIKKDLLRPPYYFNIVLGNIAGAQAKPLHLGMMTAELPDQSYWSVGAIGNCRSSIGAAGILFGDGVRVGIEDNIWYDDARTVLATNTALVERVVRLAAIMERSVASPAEVRGMLQLPGPGSCTSGRAGSGSR